MSNSLPYRPHESDTADRGEESDEDEEDVDETGYKTVKDAVLFAIEVSDSMLKIPPASDSRKADMHSPLLAALKCAYHLMQQRIISNPKDLMGILLYGTEVTKFYNENEADRGGYSFPHCYLLTDLNVQGADDVKALKAIVEDKSDLDTGTFHPSKNPVSMYNVLFCANQIFAQRAPNFTSRRLFLVTDNDNPHANDKALRNLATTRAKDLYDLGVMLELFPISSSSHSFDTKLFYDDIVYRATPSDPDAVAYNPTSFIDADKPKLKTGSKDGITLLESLISNIASKVTPKRALFSSVPLEIAPNMRISVKGYLLYKRQKPARSCYIYLGADQPVIATSSTDKQAEDSERYVEKTEIRKAYKFGGEQVVFTPEETKQIRNFGDPIIRIIGFKPVSHLPVWANIKQSTFIYPSEEHFVGSTRVFSALHHKLLKSDLMALTWFIPRRNAAPVMAALIPTLAADTEQDANLAGVSATGCPQGLHLIPLPFADDIRQNPPTVPEKPVLAPDELVDAMQLIVQQLNLPKSIYDPLRYPNPSLQWHYRILQALALDEDLPQLPEDRTIPKYKQINKRVGVEATEWMALLDKAHTEYTEQHSELVSTANSKRSAHGNTAVTSRKRVKTEAGEAMSEEEMRKLWQKGKVDSLTVAQLKDFCTAKNLALGGRKADIVEQIEGFFEAK